MSHLETHIARVEAWGNESGLYDTDSPLVQFGNMVEEVGELIMAIGKSDVEGIKDAIGDVEGIKDAIGDVRVYLIGVCAIDNTSSTEGEASGEKTEISFLLVASACLLCAIETNDPRSNLSYVKAVNDILASLAAFYNLTLEECDNHAWDQIKDRKGKTVDGEFIKEQA